MANISWKFYRSRRKIDVHRLVSSGRVIDYPTYLAYCDNVHVIPASRHEFDVEFGPALKVPETTKASVTVTPETPPSVDRTEVLEATVWMAGVDDASEQTASSPPRQKKKKSKDPDTGGDA